jgi:hypothetical protein
MATDQYLHGFEQFPIEIESKPVVDNFTELFTWELGVHIHGSYKADITAKENRF